MESSDIETMLEKYPFLTVARYGNAEYIGIIQNQDANIISMYVFDEIRSTELKCLFLELGAEWWWETARRIPINIIMGDRFAHSKAACELLISKILQLHMGRQYVLKILLPSE